jgi:hypothetical protein
MVGCTEGGSTSAAGSRIDDAVAYRNDVHMPTLLLRQGSKVMRAMLFQTSESYTLSLEEWAQKMADSIR